MIDQQAIDRLETYLHEGRLIRNAWTGTDEQGRETACLLAALVPECGVAEDAGVCPASALPPWLAHLTPWLDDAGTVEAWPGFVVRYVTILRSWNLDDAQSRRCDYLCRALIMREARNHTTDAAAYTAIDTVIALCARAAAGSPITDKEWAPADAAAYAAYAAAEVARAATAAYAAYAAAYAARDAANAARDAANAARDAAANAARDAVHAARDAAHAVRDAAVYAAANAPHAAANAARDAMYAASDRMIDGVLTVLETEIGPWGSK